MPSPAFPKITFMDVPEPPITLPEEPMTWIPTALAAAFAPSAVPMKQPAMVLPSPLPLPSPTSEMAVPGLLMTDSPRIVLPPASTSRADALLSTLAASIVTSGTPVKTPSVVPSIVTGVVMVGRAEASAMVAGPPMAN